MRIAFFHHSLRMGSGIDTVVYELANRLGKKGLDIGVFCFKSSYSAADCNFQLHEIKSSFSVDTAHKARFAVAPFIFNLKTSFKSELRGYDVINTHLYPASYIVRNVQGPLNVVTEWSSGDPSIYSTFSERLYLKWVKFATKKAARKADLVLAPCDFVSRWIQHTYDVVPITMFLDGVNFEIFDRSSASPDIVFRNHPKLEGKKIILFVGRIADTKNIHSLIEAYNIVKVRIPDTALVIVGDYTHYSGYYSKLLEIIKARNLEDDIVFAGIVSWADLPSYYAASTVYATCSLWEGFLRAESFAFGKPIVCYDVAANSETVHHGKTGLLVKPGDVERFGEYLFKLAVDRSLCNRLGENGYQWARESLDFNLIADRFVTLCKEHLDRKSRVGKEAPD